MSLETFECGERGQLAPGDSSRDQQQKTTTPASFGMPDVQAPGCSRDRPTEREDAYRPSALYAPARVPKVRTQASKSNMRESVQQKAAPPRDLGASA